MKKIRLLLVAVISGFGLVVSNIAAQEETSKPSIDAGFDLYSTYVWRGTAFSGPSLQPYVEFTAGGFALGAWGSQGYDGFQEMDLYASYSFEFGLSLGITDYYYPGTNYFDYSDSTGAHAFELNGGFEVGGFSLSANYIINEAGGAASLGGDMYFEIGYSIENVSLFVGAGDGWHTSDTEFNVCNVGIETSKDIKITDSFSVPISGSVILNPDKEQLYIVVGLSF